MSTTLKIYRCPSCNANLKITEDDSFAVCPYCGTRISIERSEPEQNGPNQMNNQLFVEDGTGTPLLTAITPDGWVKGAHIDNHFQSLGHPFTVWANAVSPKRDSQLLFNSGEQFHQIKSGQMEWHQEGVMDQRSRTPMRKFIDPAQYLDQIAPSLTQGQPFQVMQTGRLPRAYLDNIPLAVRNYVNEANQAFLSQSTGDSSVLIQNAIVDGTIRLYSYNLQGEQRILVLGAEIRALEYSITNASNKALADAVTLLFDRKKSANNGKSLLNQFLDYGKNGGAYGAAQREIDQSADIIASPNGNLRPFGQGQCAGALASYIDWEVCGVYAMMVPAPLTKEMGAAYDVFVHSIELDPYVKARMLNKTTEIGNQMKAQVQQDFTNWQRTHAAQTAAFDQYQQAYRTRSSVSDSIRSSYQNRSDAQDRARQKFSEATRGVNSYVRPDGSTTEFSSSADRVFMKNSDPSTMRSAGWSDDVPYGWSELKKKD